MRYELVWYTHEGVRKGVIQAFESLQYIKTQNAIGALVVNLPRALFQYDEFAVGDIFEVWREKGGVLELQNETAYFLQDWEFRAEADGAELLTLYAADANWLLDTAIVYAFAGSADADMTGVPDDLMKAIVRKQLGSEATADRQKLSVAPDLSQGGANISKAFAYRNVLDVMREICDIAKEKNGIWLGFDVVRTAAGEFEFRTYVNQRGQDHSRSSGDPRLVGKNYGNFSQPVFGTYHADERNWVLVAGQGEEDDRMLVVRKNEKRMTASKWNRRELFKDSRDDDNEQALIADGDAALAENTPKQRLTGTLLDTAGMLFGIHYGFGDILTAEAFGYSVDCHVSSVSVTVDQQSGEQLDVRLAGEL